MVIVILIIIIIVIIIILATLGGASLGSITEARETARMRNFTRLAETVLAQNSLSYLKIALVTIKIGSRDSARRPREARGLGKGKRARTRAEHIICLMNMHIIMNVNES